MLRLHATALNARHAHVEVRDGSALAGHLVVERASWNELVRNAHTEGPCGPAHLCLAPVQVEKGGTHAAR